MSCLILKTTNSNSPVESIHEVFGERNLRQCFGRCPSWSMLDHLPRGTSPLEKSTLRSEEPQPETESAGEEEPQQVIYPGNACQRVCKELENSNITAKCACFGEHQAEWEDYIVDDLVSKLVSKLHFPSDSRASYPSKGDLQESDIQGGDPQDAKPLASTLDLEQSKTNLTLFVKDGDGVLPAGGPGVEVSTGSLHHDYAKLRSALQGGYEKSGLGCRPKMNVSWAPDVYDPRCTSTSHLCNQNRRRHQHHPKGDHKHRHRGKGNPRSDSRKKSQRKFRRLKHADESVLSGTIFSEQSQQSSFLSMKDSKPCLDDLMPIVPRVRSVPLQKPCFPVLSLGESELITVDNYAFGIMSCF